MKLGKREQAILAFLDCPASEELLLIQFSPYRPGRRVYDSHKLRLILSRMIAKGLIIKKGTTYEKILHKSTSNS